MSSSRENTPPHPAPPHSGPGAAAGDPRPRDRVVPQDLPPAGVFATDVVAVVVFVLLGRSAHGEDQALHAVLVTLWPFLGGMLAGWLVLLLTRLRPSGYPAAGVLVVATVAVGMVLRHTVSHGGTPASFVIAASTFLTILYLGWRAVAQLIRRRRSAGTG